MRFHTSLLLFLIGLLPTLSTLVGAATCRLDDHGVVRFSNSLPITRIEMTVHGPDWSFASAESTGATARKTAPGTMHGHIPLPANCRGALEYDISLEPGQNGAHDIAVRARFTQETDIYGAYLSVYLDAERVQGRTAALFPGKTTLVLPRGKSPCHLDGTAAALTIGQPGQHSLVLAGDASAPMLVQNNRVYGGTEYEVRFFLFSRSTVRPDLDAARRLRVALVPAAEAKKVVEAMYIPPSFDPNRPFALLRAKGNVTIRRKNTTLMRILLAVHGLNWSYADQGKAAVNTTGTSRQKLLSGTLAIPASGGKFLEFRETANRKDNALALDYRLAFPRAVRLNGYQISFSAMLPLYAGRDVQLDTPEGRKNITIGTVADAPFLFEGEVRGLTLAPDAPDAIAVAVDKPTRLLIQDNRKWDGSSIEFRFCFQRNGHGTTVPAGKQIERKFLVTMPRNALQVILDETGTPVHTDTRGWVPFVMPWDKAPVDVSFLNHKPAGKFGFVTVRNGKFVFSDNGREIRFWGTCLSAGANFPSHEQAEKIARRLAAFGVNIVRTHHADAVWAERHFFRKDRDNTREFDSENLDRFDYFVACLKREGIYLYLDQLVHRHFKPGDGVDNAAALPPAAKPYTNFDPKLIALQKEFSQALWTHVNPYTGLAYKDDPAVALMEFANENDLFTQPVVLEPYRSRLEKRFRAWAESHGVALDPGPVDFTRRTPAIMRFFVDVQQSYYREMETFLRREVGVRVPMTGSNWSRNAALLVALAERPYTDSHAYWNHPGKDGVFANTPMVAATSNILDRLAFQHLEDKPLFVSEWNEPWPNEWRAELPLWMAAGAAFQGWNGLTVYTYRHSVRVPVNSLSGSFETFNDPACFGLFPAAALAFRRGDVTPARRMVRVFIPEKDALSEHSPSPWSATAFHGTTDVAAVRVVVAPKPPAGDSLLYSRPGPAAGHDIRQSRTGEMEHCLSKRLLRIDTPRTQAVTGFLQAAGTVTTRDASIEATTEFATVALSSLTNRPIAASPRILLTAVGRAENTGFAYTILRNKMLNSGAGPILIDPVRAKISLNTAIEHPCVIPIRPDGTLGSPLPVTRRHGRLHFTIGPDSRTIFYQIEENPKP